MVESTCEMPRPLHLDRILEQIDAQNVGKGDTRMFIVLRFKKIIIIIILSGWDILELQFLSFRLGTEIFMDERTTNLVGGGRWINLVD